MTFFEKANVNGKGAREVFAWLKAELPFSDGTKDVQWNFGKFLIDHEGSPFRRFGSKAPPFEMKESIEILLKKRNDKK